ncbi:hypothetical protein KCU98_g17062, partial [Aureobasidium melanogenum]
MHFNTAFAAVALVGTVSALPSKFQLEKRSATDCEAAYNACRTQFEANMSTCASEYAACLGYNPFTAAASQTAPFPIDSSYLSGPTGSVNTKPGAIGTGSVNPPTSSSVIVKPTDAPTDGSTITKTYTIPVEVTSTITSFVPCSTPVMSNSETTFFSTWLTVTYLTTTYETVTTSCETIYPSTQPTSAQASATTLPGTTVTGQPSGTCPAPETVYETVISYVTIHGGDHKTESASSATNTPIQPGSTRSWSHTGSASGSAKPSGYAKPSGH